MVILTKEISGSLRTAFNFIGKLFVSPSIKATTSTIRVIWPNTPPTPEISLVAYSNILPALKFSETTSGEMFNP